MTAYLTAEGKLSNLKRSWDIYVQSKLAASFADAGQGLDFDGSPFQDAGLREWIQPRLLGPARPPTRAYRGVDLDGTRGQGLILILQVNIFVRPVLQTVAHRIHDLRDLVMGVFHEHVKVPVVDYTGSKSTLGNMIVRRMVTDSEVSGYSPILGANSDPSTSREDYRQWTVAGEADWIETYAS